MHKGIGQQRKPQGIANIVMEAGSASMEAGAGRRKPSSIVTRAKQKLSAPRAERRRDGMDMHLTVQESERQRIAMDLHDGLGQSLVLIKVELMTATGLLAASMHREVEASLQRLKHTVHDALEELRRTVMNLRPPMLDDLGILATLTWFFREFETACRHIQIEKDFSVQENHIPEPLKVVIFRILQEVVSNVVKHANADRVQVRLSKAGGILYFSVEDNGIGFDPVQTAIHGHAGTGRGLRGIRERVQLSGGEYAFVSAVGQGTRISISWTCS